MSRGTSNTSGAIFLRIADGKIVETVSADHPKAVKRINKNSKEVFERLDDYVEGTITSIYGRTHEYNGEESKELCIRIQGDGETYQLSLKEGSRYWSGFAVRMPNLDLTKPVKFSPYSFTDKESGSNVQGINLFQGEQKIQPRFTKENPGKMPQGVQVPFQGKLKWDFYERDQFLIKVVDHFAGVLKASSEALYGESGTVTQAPVASQPQPQSIAGTGRGTQPVQADPQPVMAPMAPPPSAPYPQPQHITSDVDDLPW